MLRHRRDFCGERAVLIARASGPTVWQLQPLLPEGIRLHSVTVAEKDVQSATYMEAPDHSNLT